MSARTLFIILLLASSAIAQDAEILSWDQTFSWKADGSLVRRDHKKVLIRSSRAYRDFADPRIDYEEGRETVKIRKAVTHLADGTELPVPEYSYNLASPGDVVGWPAWAAWRQKIVTFSGLEPGVVVELDYEIESRPRVYRWLEADLRLEGRYPTRSRTVTVLVPDGTRLRQHLSPEEAGEYRVTLTARGDVLHRWTFENLAAAPDEPQSLPWRERCARLAFTTVKDSTAIDSALLGTIDRTAVAGKDIDALADEAAKGVDRPDELAGKLAKMLKETLHVIRSRKTWRSAGFRPAEIVLREGYGSPPELASLMVALLRRAGYDAVPALLLDEQIWSGSPGAFGTWAVRDFLVQVDRGDDTLLIHPTEGPIEQPVEEPGLLVRDLRSRSTHHLDLRGPHSEMTVSGRLILDQAGKLTGRLELAATGLFFDPKALRTEDGRKAWLGRQVGGLISGLTVESHTVERLTTSEFRTKLTVKLDRPWLKHGKTMLFKTGDGPLFLQRFPLPLARSDRRTDVRIDGPFDEIVDVVIEIPDGLSVSAPPGIDFENEEWGKVAETIETVPDGIRIRREIRLRRQFQLVERPPSEAFEELRTAVNSLRSAGARTWAVSVSPGTSSSGRSSSGGR